MKTTAAVLVETGKPLTVTEIEIPPLQAGQSIVEIKMSGVCHNQVGETRGTRGEDKFLPHCLGHEGFGVIKEVGPGVKKVKPGDHVILSWMKGSGFEVPGTKYQWGGKAVNSGAITTFSRYSVISENRLNPVNGDLSPKEAALFGCAIPTGLGAVMNTAAARPGQSIAIFGTGGVGLCAVAGAALAGCYPIIAIDINPMKLETAKKVGATHVINAGSENPLEKIKSLVPEALDIAIEASGQPVAMQQALESVRPRGGTAVVIGNAKFGSKLELNPRQLNDGKRLLGTWGGDNDPDRDFPRYVKLLRSGRLKLDAFTTQTYKLENINQALDDLEAGRAIRPLIDMTLA